MNEKFPIFLWSGERADPRAYKERFETCKRVKNDMTYCKNPYPEGSKEAQSWLIGWNEYYEPDEMII